MGLGCQPCEAFGPVAPASPIDGALWVDSSSGPPYQLQRWNLAAGAWQAVGIVSGGGGGSSTAAPFPLAPVPPVSGWTALGTGAKTDIAGGVRLVGIASAGNSACALVRPRPSAPPWKATVAITQVFPGADFMLLGLLARESSTGKLAGVGPRWSGGRRLQGNRYASLTSAGAGFGAGSVTDAIYQTALLYLRVQDDGTNLFFEVSTDGWNYGQITSEARTAFMASGADQWGVLVDSYTSGRVPAMQVYSVTENI